VGRKAHSDAVVQEFRERLVEAATHLFATQGFEGVTLRAVAAGHLQGDPTTLAHLLWCGVHGIASLDLAGKLMNGRTADELVGPMMDMMARGDEQERGR